MSQSTLMRWPASEFVSLREAMDRLLSESVVNSPFRTLWSSGTNGNSARLAIPLDVYATNDEVVIVASTPGLSPDDLNITVDQGTVTISGQIHNAAASEEGKGATWYLHELPYGTFQRSVSLPFEVDSAQADAAFDHGILRLRLPKVEQARPKQIKVRVGGTETAPETQPEAITQG
jgi:HSP20 family protein